MQQAGYCEGRGASEEKNKQKCAYSGNVQEELDSWIVAYINGIQMFATVRPRSTGF